MSHTVLTWGPHAYITFSFLKMSHPLLGCWVGGTYSCRSPQEDFPLASATAHPTSSLSQLRSPQGPDI